MTLKMIVNSVDPEEIRIALLDNGRLTDFDIETRGSATNTGNIYKGRVVDVMPSLNAAFVNYGADKQGFLTANDVNPRISGIDESKLDKAPSIEELLKPGQDILVQVTKDEVGKKGAVLTTYLALAGRYVVLMPSTNRQGVSRKIQDEESRRKMREAADKLRVPDGMGVIIRTAGRDRDKIALARDLKILLRLWDTIQKDAQKKKAPFLLFKEQDVILRALRDYLSPEIDEVVLDSDDAFDRAADYMRMVMPRQRGVLSRYVENRPIFHHWGIEDQLDTIFRPKVPLESGGSLVIEPTEALVSIDVNSGKQKAGGHEETAFATNLEAAEEVARQLRLRDLGGIIVCDFIDMNYRSNQQKVERAMKAALRKDRAKVKVSRISRNGTLELTRQRVRTSVQASVFRRCPTCTGTGWVMNPESHSVAVLRKVMDRAARADLKSAKVDIEWEAGELLRTTKWSAVQELEKRYGIRIEVQQSRALLPGQVSFTFETNQDASPLELEPPNFGPTPKFDIPEDELDGDDWDVSELLKDEADTGDDEIDEDIEDQEEDDAEESDGGSDAEDSAPKKGRRGRRGRKKGGQKERTEQAESSEEDTQDAGDGEIYDLPGYKLIAPHKLGFVSDEDEQDEESSDESTSDDDASSNKRPGKSRRRRRRRGKKPQQEASGESVEAGSQEDVAAEADTPDETSALEPVQEKPGLIAWLLRFLGLK